MSQTGAVLTQNNKNMRKRTLLFKSLLSFRFAHVTVNYRINQVADKKRFVLMGGDRGFFFQQTYNRFESPKFWFLPQISANFFIFHPLFNFVPKNNLFLLILWSLLILKNITLRYRLYPFTSKIEFSWGHLALNSTVKCHAHFYIYWSFVTSN